MFIINLLAKIFKYIFMGLFLLFVLTFIFVFALGRTSLPKNAEAAIVLGAAIRTPAIEGRALTGLALAEKDITETLVLTGGFGVGTKISEAAYMKSIIDKKSQESPEMLLEEKSHTTRENIENAKGLIPKAENIVIVSDCFHLSRGYLIAKLEGFDRVYRACPQPSYYGRNELIYYYMREIAAVPVIIVSYLK